MNGVAYSTEELSKLHKIEGLLVGYCYAVDDGDARAVVALFATSRSSMSAMA